MVLLVATSASAQKRQFNILAYYAGGPEQVNALPAEKLSHVIFSFCHLKGNELIVDNKRDSTTIFNLVKLKERNPKLKVILSLGGWGGCPSCSDVFSSAEGIKEFSSSVLALNRAFGSDGIDLDWEYPAIEGYPGHKFKPEDKDNFTLLVQELRRTLDPHHEISFAAGGFTTFLEQSVDWTAVMKEVDRVNLMSYDLINGYSTVTGHHTALYSRPSQIESTDNGVQYLVKQGVPREKIVIGAAFYARVWENVKTQDNGLYQSGKFKTAIDYRNFSKDLSEKNGFKFYWDDLAKAPYAYNEKEKLFATFDDVKSLELKSKYVMDQNLDGIMFWEISHDTDDHKLVNAINKVKDGKLN